MMEERVYWPVKTGDSSDITRYLLVATFAIIAVAFCGVKIKRRNE